MSIRGYRENSEVLHAVLLDYAPNAAAQQKCTELLWTMQREGLEEKQIALAFARVIADGLAYGNWPWTERFGNDVGLIEEEPDQGEIDPSEVISEGPGWRVKGRRV